MVTCKKCAAKHPAHRRSAESSIRTCDTCSICLTEHGKQVGLYVCASSSAIAKEFAKDPQCMTWKHERQQMKILYT